MLQYQVYKVTLYREARFVSNVFVDKSFLPVKESIVNLLSFCNFKEKSKLDWESFKDQEGIHDELRNFNKDGCVI